MSNTVIKFPVKERTKNDNLPNVAMMLTRKLNGVTVHTNLSNLSKEELLLALLPPQREQLMDDKQELVKKYINQ